ncbi:MAG: Hsp20/alpha crystallin family protein [Tunicatimonas sp.]
MRPHILHNGLHRIGDRTNHFIDGERFLGRDPFDEPWMTSHSRPATNVVQHRKHYDLEVALPGFKKEDLSLIVQDHKLTVIAQKDRAVYGKQGVQQAFPGQTQRRTFRLPKSVCADDIHASLRAGILHIRLSYEPTTTPTTIAVE